MSPVERVWSAWNDPGIVPSHHRTMQGQLFARWPALASALAALPEPEVLPPGDEVSPEEKTRATRAFYAHGDQCPNTQLAAQKVRELTDQLEATEHAPAHMVRLTVKPELTPNVRRLSPPVIETRAPVPSAEVQEINALYNRAGGQR